MLIRNVDVREPSSQPFMVWVIATASSEVSWNGVVIGRNGVPGPDAARERPGRFIATVPVPPERVKPGRNVLTVRLSAHHLWLPVRREVQQLYIGPYETVTMPGLSSYLPALLMLGALAAAGFYFAAARLIDRADRNALLLASIAGLALLQLGAETARSFVAYTYPWHVVRIAAVALLATLVSVLIAVYAARRFAPAWTRGAVAVTSAAGLGSLLFIPWYDIKALAALVTGALTALICSVRGLRKGVPGSRVAASITLLFFAMLAWQRSELLDQSYYILLAAILVGLVAEQLLDLRHARHGREAETLRADALETKLRELRRRPAGIALLKDGGRTHRVAEEDIIYARAADDYCEIILRGGRTLLVTMTLARVAETLSARFVRVHKSYLVNASEVATIASRPGGGRQLVLGEGTTVPVGRSYLAAVSSL